MSKFLKKFKYKMLKIIQKRNDISWKFRSTGRKGEY